MIRIAESLGRGSTQPKSLSLKKKSDRNRSVLRLDSLSRLRRQESKTKKTKEEWKRRAQRESISDWLLIVVVRRETRIYCLDLFSFFFFSSIRGYFAPKRLCPFALRLLKHLLRSLSVPVILRSPSFFFLFFVLYLLMAVGYSRRRVVL